MSHHRLHELNAYERARFIVPGCQHRLGCKCDPPYWLRESTPAERAFEDRRVNIPLREVQHEPIESLADEAARSPRT